MSAPVRRVILAAALSASIAFVSLGTTGCVPTNGDPDILTRSLPTDVSAEGVLLAAVILKSGDIESALEAGLVTPAEADEAVRALREGTLDLWQKRAAQDR